MEVSALITTVLLFSLFQDGLSQLPSTTGPSSVPSTKGPTTLPSTQGILSTSFVSVTAGSTPETTLRGMRSTNTPSGTMPSTTAIAKSSISSDATTTTMVSTSMIQNTLKSTQAVTGGPGGPSGGPFYRSCDFEDAEEPLCGFTIYVQGSVEVTSVSVSGSPSAGRTGGGSYLYKTDEGATETLTFSTEVPIASCLEFWYSLYRDGASVEILGLSPNLLQPVETILSLSYNSSQTTDWMQVSRTIPSKFTKVGITVNYGVAIDDVILSIGSCDGSVETTTSTSTETNQDSTENNQDSSTYAGTGGGSATTASGATVLLVALLTIFSHKFS